MYVWRESGRGALGDILSSFNNPVHMRGEEADELVSFYDQYFAGHFNLRRYPVWVRRFLILVYPFSWILFYIAKALFFAFVVVFVLVLFYGTLFVVDNIWTRLAGFRSLWSDPPIVYKKKSDD